ATFIKRKCLWSPGLWLSTLTTFLTMLCQNDKFTTPGHNALHLATMLYALLQCSTPCHNALRLAAMLYTLLQSSTTRHNALRLAAMLYTLYLSDWNVVSY